MPTRVARQERGCGSGQLIPDRNTLKLLTSFGTSRIASPPFLVDLIDAIAKSAPKSTK